MTQPGLNADSSSPELSLFFGGFSSLAPGVEALDLARVSGLRVRSSFARSGGRLLKKVKPVISRIAKIAIFQCWLSTFQVEADFDRACSRLKCGDSGTNA